MTPKRPWHETLKTVLLLVTSLTVAFAIGELAARQRAAFKPYQRFYVGEMPNRPSPNFVADEHTGWRLRPRHAFQTVYDGQTVVVQSNAQGFYANTDFDTTETRPVIAFLGDSFTFGTGVPAESTFSALVQRALPGVVSYNFAMPGAGLDQVWMSLRHQAAAYHPRLVVVAFIDDDLRRSQTAYRQFEGFSKPLFVVEADTLRPARPNEGPNALVRYLDAHSWLFNAGRAAGVGAGHVRPVGDWWKLNATIMRALVADARRIGVPVVVVRLWPPKDFSTFRELMSQLGVSYFDLADPRLPHPASLRLPHDSHPSPAGHRFVADTLLGWIREHQPGLLGGAATH